MLPVKVFEKLGKLLWGEETKKDPPEKKVKVVKSKVPNKLESDGGDSES